MTAPGSPIKPTEVVHVIVTDVIECSVVIDASLGQRGQTDWDPLRITLQRWDERVLMHELLHAILGSDPEKVVGKDDPQHEYLVRRITRGLMGFGFRCPEVTR